MNLTDYCIKTGNENLLSEWNRERNHGINPEEFSKSSRTVVWWKCEKGHEWQTSIDNRTNGGNGCPYCANRRLLKGYNDLETLFPDIAKEWHPQKNGSLIPSDVLAFTHKKVWWKCKKGHEWCAEIMSRTSKRTGCPICANRKLLKGYNDLETLFPDTAREWHPQKNGSLMPSDVLAFSHKKVWWKCEKGHEWCAEITSRTYKETGCPICANKVIISGENDLATMFPHIAKEWHPQRNGTLKPEDVSPFSNRKVWWMCKKGHEWQAVINLRTSRNTRCPFCSNRKVLPGFNDLATTNPNLVSEWHLTLNGELKPDAVTYGSRKKVWWICKEGHIWKASIFSRAGKQGTGCPVCAGISASRYEIYRGEAD